MLADVIFSGSHMHDYDGDTVSEKVDSSLDRQHYHFVVTIKGHFSINRSHLSVQCHSRLFITYARTHDSCHALSLSR